MAEDRRSDQRALLNMLRPDFQRTYPAAGEDEDDRQMIALLKKADRRRIIAAPPTPGGKPRR